MKRILILGLLLVPLMANAGVLKFTSKKVIKPAAKTSAKMTVKTAKLAKKAIW